jgi:hypothetical protein
LIIPNGLNDPKKYWSVEGENVNVEMSGIESGVGGLQEENDVCKFLEAAMCEYVLYRSRWIGSASIPL